MVLQENIDFACGQEGVDCTAIRPGGVCYEPDTVQAHAAYAMNLYFQSNGRHAYDCDFGDTGVVTTADPSKIDILPGPILPIRQWSSVFLFLFLYTLFVYIKNINNKKLLAHTFWYNIFVYVWHFFHCRLWRLQIHVNKDILSYNTIRSSLVFFSFYV